MAIIEHSGVRVGLDLRRHLPDYGVVQLGDAFVPVRLHVGRVFDVWTSGNTGITAFGTLDAAWGFIEDETGVSD